MSQIRPGGYGLGAQPAFGAEGAPESNPLDAIREQTSKIEDFLDTMSEPIKP